MIHRTDDTANRDGCRYLGYLDEGYSGEYRLSVALAQWATHRGVDLATEGLTLLPRVNVSPGYWSSTYRGKQFTTGSDASA